MGVDRNKVYKEALDTIDKLDANLNKLKLNVISEKSETNKLISLIKNEIDIYKESIEELKQPFLLFVIGPGKYGKTSLINALMKDSFLEVKDIPNTWKLDSIIYSKDEKIEIIYNNKHSKTFDYDEGINIIKNEEIKSKNSKNKIRCELERYKNSKKISIDELKRYKKDLEKTYMYKSNICEVRYFINKNGILNDFIIVDTPGFNQSLLEYTNSRMIDYYNKCDGIIWILDSQNVISKSSNDLLEDLKKNYSMEKNKNNIICVVNKIDIIKNDITNVQKVIEKVNLLYSQNFNDIIMLSAKNAIDGILNNDNTLINNSNIKALENSIETNFKKKSEKIQIKSKQQNLKLMKVKIVNYINEYKRNLYYEINEINENKKLLNESLTLGEEYILEYIKTYISFENLIKNDINLEINLLENIINKKIFDLNNSFKFFNKKIDEDYEFKIDFKFNISNFSEITILKNLIREYNQINRKNDLYLNILSNKNLNNNYKLNINRYIDNLKSKTTTEVLKILTMMEKNKLHEIHKSFSKKYTSFEVIKEHIIFINNIYDIIVI